MREKLKTLYEGNSARAARFRYALFALDLIAIVYVVASSFGEQTALFIAMDIVFGIVLLADFIARAIIADKPWRSLLHPVAIADMVAIVSFILPLVDQGFAFLRILRTLRLLHTYQLLRRLRRDVRFFRANEQVILATLHLCIFIFVMTGIVYQTQHKTNPDIGNYADALYFTVTALTTTGFGDITLPGTWGRLLSVLIMIFGVTLFLRLAQVLFRPGHVKHECPTCGLTRHDSDAVHCKHCGEVLHIETEGG